MNPISVHLMMIVDTVAQVAQQGRWRPSFDVSTTANLHFRPADFDYSRPTGTWEKLHECHHVSIVPTDIDHESEVIEQLQDMLEFARRHLTTKPE